jgi:hypothetical protein
MDSEYEGKKIEPNGKKTGRKTAWTLKIGGCTVPKRRLPTSKLSCLTPENSEDHSYTEVKAYKPAEPQNILICT